jgi:hypothetical protein
VPELDGWLDVLRGELGRDRIELGELVVLGADAKLAAIRAERGGRTELRRRLAERVRSGSVPVSLKAAEDHDELIEELLALPQIRVDEEIERRAADAQRSWPVQDTTACPRRPDPRRQDRPPLRKRLARFSRHALMGLTGRHLNQGLRNRIKALHGGTPTGRRPAA